MVRKQKGGGSLGSSLRKDKNKAGLKKAEFIRENKAEDVHEDKKKGKMKFISEVERDGVNDFIYNAELQQQKFDAIKQRKLVTTDGVGGSIVIDLATGTKDGPSDELMASALKEMETLRIPRRPAWDGKRTKKDQILLENTVYVDWRRDLAKLEEKFKFIHVTPYEKNIEIWRQLWMVIERSDILVQIVDCRDPEFFRCVDLERYVHEVGAGKLNFLLLNKADLLEEPIRQVWSDYFNKLGIRHIFFSAKNQQQEIDRDVLEGEVTAEAIKFTNTANVVTRGVLKAILKAIVLEYKVQAAKEKERHAEAERLEKEAAKNVEEHQNSDQAGGPADKPAEASEAEVVAKKEPQEPSLKILKVVDEAEIKDKPVVNLYEAMNKLKAEEEKKRSARLAAAAKAKQEKETRELKDPKHNHSDHDSDYEDDEEGEEEGDEDEPKPEPNIYERLGVDRHALNSKPFHEKKDDDNIVIGMIGFPNVGKSSVINVLCNRKLVGVGSRPGKTKNFQTIFLEKHLVLCDCPGLVFPSIVHSKAHMACNSVIAIDSIKDYMAPMALICSRIPVRVLEVALKCPFFWADKMLEAGRMLHVFAKNRGMISGSGMPNYAEAAKFILKKYVAGELLFAALPLKAGSDSYPESVKECQYNKVPLDYKQTTPESIHTEGEKQYIQEEKIIEDDMDDEFFEPPVDVGGILENLTQDDVINLVMGKNVNGIKLDKFQRRELKFAIKRDAESDEIAAILGSFLGKTGQSSVIKTKKVPVHHTH